MCLVSSCTWTACWLWHVAHGSGLAYQSYSVCYAVSSFHDQTVPAAAAAVHRLISYIYPSRNQELVEKLQAKKATVIGEGLGGPATEACTADCCARQCSLFAFLIAILNMHYLLLLNICHLVAHSRTCTELNVSRSALAGYLQVSN